MAGSYCSKLAHTHTHTYTVLASSIQSSFQSQCRIVAFSAARSTLGYRQRSVFDMLLPRYGLLWATNVLHWNYNTEVSWHTKTQRYFQNCSVWSFKLKKIYNWIRYCKKKELHKHRPWETGSFPLFLHCSLWRMTIGFAVHMVFSIFRSTHGVLNISQYTWFSQYFAVHMVFSFFRSTRYVLIVSQYTGCSHCFAARGQFRADKSSVNTEMLNAYLTTRSYEIPTIKL
jgi:hypothetical protein